MHKKWGVLTVLGDRYGVSSNLSASRSDRFPRNQDELSVAGGKPYVLRYLWMPEPPQRDMRTPIYDSIRDLAMPEAAESIAPTPDGWDWAGPHQAESYTGVSKN